MNGEWKFKKDFTLEQNLSYWIRRFEREAKTHREQKSKSKIIADQVFHGVSSSQMFRFSRILRAIVKKMENPRMVEMADTLVLGTSAPRHESSSLSSGTE